MKKQVIIVGAGFAGLRAAKTLAKDSRFEITLIDRNNHHLFQPLLFQVAMAGLSATDISVPIRSLFTKQRNVKVIMENVKDILLSEQKIICHHHTFNFDYLILACGAHHSYFGNEQWEENAPGLKTLSQALEIRRRVLCSFERAEKETNPEKKKTLLTFAIIGGGPTGVELAGAIGELRNFTLKNNFRSIDPTLARIVLVEAGERILSSFHPKLATKATKCLQSLGVEVITNCKVTEVNRNGITANNQEIKSGCVLWAAGNQASKINQRLGCPLDRNGRAIVQSDLSLPNQANIFVLGDQAHFKNKNGLPLPALAPVALQQGKFIARLLQRIESEKPRNTFRYKDRGQLATIGRSYAVVQIEKIKMSGFFAWILWLTIHIYFLIDFKNRILVLTRWAWQYISYSQTARIIVPRHWRFHSNKK